VFTRAELDYLASQRLGRLATVASDGTLQNSPVGFRVDADAGVIRIHGRALGATRKFRNIVTNANVAFVVDDIASFDPWTVRCLEIRGVAEALTDVEPPWEEEIRVHPRRVISWGLGPGGDESSRRTIEESPTGG
jgi:pyridoxamine 5'-phosphate oxidase family protein